MALQLFVHAYHNTTSAGRLCWRSHTVTGSKQMQTMFVCLHRQSPQMLRCDLWPLSPVSKGTHTAVHECSLWMNLPWRGMHFIPSHPKAVGPRWLYRVFHAYIWTTAVLHCWLALWSSMRLYAMWWRLLHDQERLQSDVVYQCRSWKLLCLVGTWPAGKPRSHYYCSYCCHENDYCYRWEYQVGVYMPSSGTTSLMHTLLLRIKPQLIWYTSQSARKLNRTSCFLHQ